MPPRLTESAAAIRETYRSAAASLRWQLGTIGIDIKVSFADALRDRTLIVEVERDFVEFIPKEWRGFWVKVKHGT